MDRIGVRELRQHASRWLRLVAMGETYEITVRGVPVARLSPIISVGNALEQLSSEGLVSLATEDFDDLLDSLGLPLEISSGVVSASQRLIELRDDER